MVSGSDSPDKLRRDARDLVAMLRRVDGLVLMEAARLVERHAEQQTIAPSSIDRLFEQLRGLGWDGTPRAIDPEQGWDVVMQCKVCLEVIRSERVRSADSVKRIARSFIAGRGFHSDFQFPGDTPCHGLLEVLGLGR
jgi:hypothetical protein